MKFIRGDPRFLYPTSREFPFDEVTGQIVRALEERGFDVPGIRVEMDSYGPSHSYRKVETVVGDDFRIRYGRPQGRIGPNLNDTAAVSEINIPKKELHVYDDNSGPTLYLFVGDNWEEGKHAFEDHIKVNSKLSGKPRTYLIFRGSWQKSGGRVYYPGKVAPFLAHTDDSGREYDPKEDEPRYFETQGVFNEFKEFLQRKLEKIVQLEPATK